MKTIAQILAEWSAEGKIRFQGMTIQVENPKGSVRKGIDKVTGEPWQTKMLYPYGEIENSRGMDGDPVDVYVGPNKGAKFAYVVHQLDPNTGEFDEDKVMLGFTDAMEAKQAYCQHYDDQGKKFFGSMSTVPMDVFKKKVLASQEDSRQIAGSGSKMATAFALYQKIKAGGT